MAKLFLSYAHRDSDIAAALSQALIESGYQVFDAAHDIVAGKSWRDGIKAAIAAADALIVVVGSPEAVSGSWVAYEAGIADARGMPVIVLASNHYPLDRLPMDLMGYALAPLDPDKPEEAVGALREALKATAA